VPTLKGKNEGTNKSFLIYKLSLEKETPMNTITGEAFCSGWKGERLCGDEKALPVEIADEKGRSVLSEHQNVAV